MLHVLFRFDFVHRTRITPTEYIFMLIAEFINLYYIDELIPILLLPSIPIGALWILDLGRLNGIGGP